ncbi:MAG: cupin domain-containing protein [Planctomycetes bacterium]|nr:cupin domain-containing protein [Planctomycetota bacterium]
MPDNRNPKIRNIDEVEAVESSRGEKFGNTRRKIAAATGSANLGCSHFELAPGRQAFPHHYHYANEEAFYILEGEGELRLGDDHFPIRAGDYIACPTGSECAHAIINTSGAPLKFLGISTAIQCDVVFYPDSKKFAAWGGRNVHTALQGPHFVKILKDQPNVDYYEGEE